MSFKTSSAKATLAALAFSITALSGQSAIAETKSAYFAGGCFWCIEKDFENVDGVKEVESGYQGGEIENPTYRNHPGYIESVRIDYDPAAINYAQLLKIFFRTVDPTDAGGQFCDRGHAYTTAIFAGNTEETKLANAAIAEAGGNLGKILQLLSEAMISFGNLRTITKTIIRKTQSATSITASVVDVIKL
jgi:peptide-methionine (S)-S-oxide reductase